LYFRLAAAFARDHSAASFGLLAATVFSCLRVAGFFHRFFSHYVTFLAFFLAVSESSEK
jgi:hypothetical protein